MGLTARKHHPPARRRVGPTDKTTIKSSKFIILTRPSTDFRLSTGRDARGAQPPGGKGHLRAHSESPRGFLDRVQEKARLGRASVSVAGRRAAVNLSCRAPWARP